MLPQEVKDAFKGGVYAQWRVDDVDIVERNGKDTLFVMDVEQGKDERLLYFNARGELVRESRSSNDDYRSLL